jgi:hypothetical protein
MRPTPVPPRPWPAPVATQLRLGRVDLLGALTLAGLIGGAVWLLSTQARPLVAAAVDSTAWPAWLRQVQSYPPTEPEPAKAAAVVPDPNVILLAKLAAIQADLERQRQELEALKKRPSGTTIVQPPPPQAAKVTPPAKATAAMLYVAHEVKEEGAKAKATEYTLAPGATKLPVSSKRRSTAMSKAISRP